MLARLLNLAAALLLAAASAHVDANASPIKTAHRVLETAAVTASGEIARVTLDGIREKWLVAEECASGVSSYLYANGNPVTYTDPSGYSSLTEVNMAQSIQSSMTTVLRYGGGALNAYNRISAAVDFIQLGSDLGRVFATGGVVDALHLQLAGFPKGVNVGQVTQMFLWGGARATAAGAMNWASGYVKSSRNHALEAFLLYLPNPSPGTGLFTSITSGIKIDFRVNGKKKKIPLKLVLGAPKGAYGQLAGVGMQMGKMRQLYRMDYHDWHGTRGAGTGVKSYEIAAWKDPTDGDYHHHVNKWTGE